MSVRLSLSIWDKSACVSIAACWGHKPGGGLLEGGKRLLFRLLSPENFGELNIPSRILRSKVCCSVTSAWEFRANLVCVRICWTGPYTRRRGGITQNHASRALPIFQRSVHFQLMTWGRRQEALKTRHGLSLTGISLCAENAETAENCWSLQTFA